MCSQSKLIAVMMSIQYSGSQASNYYGFVQGSENLSTSGPLEAINLPDTVGLLILRASGSTVFGNGQYRGFFVYSGTVEFQNVASTT